MWHSVLGILVTYVVRVTQMGNAMWKHAEQVDSHHQHKTGNVCGNCNVALCTSTRLSYRGNETACFELFHRLPEIHKYNINLCHSTDPCHLGFVPHLLLIPLESIEQRKLLTKEKGGWSYRKIIILHGANVVITGVEFMYQFPQTAASCSRTTQAQWKKKNAEDHTGEAKLKWKTLHS